MPPDLGTVVAAPSSTVPVAPTRRDLDGDGGCAACVDGRGSYGAAVPWTERSLETARLRLRPFRDADRPTVVTLLTDPDVRRYLGGPAELPDDFATHPLGEQPDVWAAEVVATGESIGSCSFTDDRGSLELSYSFVPSAWGQGYASEACAAVLGWAWSTTDVDRIIAVTQSANERSIALLERLGFAERERFEEFGAEQCLFELGRPSADAG